MIKILINILIFISTIYATTLQELIDSGLENSAIFEKNSLELQYIEAKIDESQAKKFGEFRISWKLQALQ